MISDQFALALFGSTTKDYLKPNKNYVNVAPYDTFLSNYSQYTSAATNCSHLISQYDEIDCDDPDCPILYACKSDQLNAHAIHDLRSLSKSVEDKLTLGPDLTIDHLKFNITDNPPYFSNSLAVQDGQLGLIFPKNSILNYWLN